jgi:hypothetical protein
MPGDRMHAWLQIWEGKQTCPDCFCFPIAHLMKYRITETIGLELNVTCPKEINKLDKLLI